MTDLFTFKADFFSMRHRWLSMRLLISFAALLFAIFPPAAEAQIARENQTWSGNYSFEDQGAVLKRRRFSDVVPYASYDLRIEEKANGELAALLSVNGTQIFETYDCTVKVNGRRLEFYYEKLTAPGVKNTRRFKRGELLFTLEGMRIGSLTKYLFLPAAYEIARLDKSRQNQPVYFVRQ